ncbi:AraC-like DNA-binding protein [Dyadobacter jejuensis]|uniref:AraC-like DNA-binding protein n=1 Tax=Dyadobacter jejuensis TaxID=1082580 RepID=A0A316AH07_9BACT|nr:helix-turn-helix transcriptional regulator [Dyadobacter jejuensis]PWJ56932.1 AraC-like DNA-binding protein [Dyadobacter jejuensis]
METIPHVHFKNDQEPIGFEAIDLQELLKQPQRPLDHNPFAAHRIHFFAVLFISKGTATHRLDFNEYTLQSGQCLIIAKDQIHAFDPSMEYEGTLLIFTDTFLFRYLAPAVLGKITWLFNYHSHTSQYDTFPHFSPLLEMVHDIQNRGTIKNPSPILASLLSVMLLEFEAHTPTSHNDPLLNTEEIKIFEMFRTEVVTHYRHNRNANYFAQKLGISYKHLNEICKTFTQTTAKSFIDQYIILEAKRHLNTSALSIKEITYLCGFDEPTNFQKYFKKMTNETPRKFRSRNRYIIDLP